MKIRPKEASGGCCATTKANEPCCPPAPKEGKEGGVMRADSTLTWKDTFAHLRCRLGSYRTKYMVTPGLYALGNPGKESDVFVTANYGMSFDKLRASLSGLDAWILVLDTKGINVWCAAGKGTFGTDELIKKIFSTGLFSVVTHRRLILPQLGGPGVASHEVKRQTGFRVIYGPVEASDIKGFVEAGYKANPAMRRASFDILDRLVLTPMEIRPAMKGFLIFAALVLVVSGLSPAGISWDEAAEYGVPLTILGAASVASGAFLTPVLLPWVPFRSFALKGWVMGLLTVFVSGLFLDLPANIYLDIASYVFFPLVSSYVALQFTGSTVYTGISGVKKELRYSIPVYIAGTVVSLALLVAFKITGWGGL